MPRILAAVVIVVSLTFSAWTADHEARQADAWAERARKAESECMDLRWEVESLRQEMKEDCVCR